MLKNKGGEEVSQIDLVAQKRKQKENGREGGGKRETEREIFLGELSIVQSFLLG